MGVPNVLSPILVRATKYITKTKCGLGYYVLHYVYSVKMTFSFFFHTLFFLYILYQLNIFVLGAVEKCS